MPILSRFFGISIVMRYEAKGKHHESHFHASYGEFKAVYSCKGELLAGNLPPKQHKLVCAWAALHETELEENWYLASVHGECFAIDPLR